jgi:hypothetical protein
VSVTTPVETILETVENNIDDEKISPMPPADVTETKAAEVTKASSAGQERKGKTVGRIHESIDYWFENFPTDSYVLDILRNGYEIPVNWELIPDSYEESDNKSARDHYAFVCEETDRLLVNGQIVEWPCRPRCVNPLTVAKKRKEDGTLKLRLVLDLSRCVNLAIADDKFRMATIQDALNGTRQGDFQLTFDLKSAFHHLALHPSYYELMGFKINRDGKVRYFVFTVLVFGMKVSSQALGRMLKPLCTYLTQNGVPIVLYVDDGRVVGPTKAEAVRRFKFALDTLRQAGWQISIEKTFTPDQASTRVEFLGMEIDSASMRVHAPKEKLRLIKESLANVIKDRMSMPVKNLASIVGKLISLEKAFGPAILVGTRMASIQIDETSSRYSWNGFLYMTDDTRSALRRVLRSLDDWDGFSIRTPETAITLTSVLANEPESSVERKIPNRKLFGQSHLTMVSDASDDMVAAYGMNGRLKDFVFTQHLLPHERAFSSTQRELAAVLKTLLCKGEQLRMQENTTLWWLTDSRNVQTIFSKGSNNIEMMRQTLQVLELARGLNLDLQPIWVSRDDPRIQRADAMSKEINTDDWSIHEDAFRELERWAGPFTVDLFANAQNRKVEKFFSYTYADSCAGVDAMVHSWSGETVYCAPPISMILRVVRKLEKSKTTGVLLVPLWRGAKFWLHAFPDGRHLSGLFSEMRKMRIKTDSWSVSPKDCFGGGKWVHFLALRIQGTGSGFQDSVVKKDKCFSRMFDKDCVC